MHGFQGDCAHQHPKVRFLGLGHLLGTQGEKGPQPAVNSPNLGSRRRDELLPFPLARCELLDSKTEGVEGIAQGVGKPPREVAELRQVFSLLPQFALCLELGEPRRHPVERTLQIPDLTGRGHWNLDSQIAVAERLGPIRKRPQRPSQPARHHRGRKETDEQQDAADRRSLAHRFLDLFNCRRHRYLDPMDGLVVLAHH